MAFQCAPCEHQVHIAAAVHSWPHFKSTLLNTFIFHDASWLTCRWSPACSAACTVQCALC
eukprot:351965-Chlamydomonas_euryale.AAC.29